MRMTLFPSQSGRKSFLSLGKKWGERRRDGGRARSPSAYPSSPRLLTASMNVTGHWEIPKTEKTLAKSFLVCLCFHLHIVSWRHRKQLVYYFLKEVSISWQGKCRLRHSKTSSTCARSSKEMGSEQRPRPAVNICPSRWCCRDGRVSGAAACRLGAGQYTCRLLSVRSRCPRQPSPTPGVHRPPSAGMRDCQGDLSSIILWNRDCWC